MGLRCRRDLDLQVAEAVRFTSETAREVTQARLQRDEAAMRLEQARWDFGSTKLRSVEIWPDPDGVNALGPVSAPVLRQVSKPYDFGNVRPHPVFQIRWTREAKPVDL